MPYDDESWHATRERVRIHVRELAIGGGLSAEIATRLADAGRMNRGTLFCLLAGAPIDGDAQGPMIGAGLELVHRASVIHDDIEDDDRLRRGAPTEFALLGVPGAIAVADVLLATGLRTLVSLAPTAADRVLSTLERMARGQYCDMYGQPGVLADDPFHVAELKTGSLLGLTFSLGGLHAGRTAADCDALEAIGCDLGTSFQLANDVANVTRSEGRGKSIGSDLDDSRNSSVTVLIKSYMSELGPGASRHTLLTRAVGEVEREIARRLDSARLRAAALDQPLPAPVHALVADEAVAGEFVGDQQAARPSAATPERRPA